MHTICTSRPLAALMDEEMQKSARQSRVRRRAIFQYLDWESRLFQHGSKSTPCADGAHAARGGFSGSGENPQRSVMEMPGVEAKTLTVGPSHQRMSVALTLCDEWVR